MSRKCKVIFIGNFLSKTNGTKGVSEHLAENLRTKDIEVSLVSRFENKFLRLLDVVISLVFGNYKKVHIDVFSGNSFVLAEIASFLGRFRRKSILLTLHGGRLVEFSVENKTRLKKLFVRANLIQTPSRFLQQHFISEGFDIEYLPNSIVSENFEFNRERVKPFSILWVRSFSPIYNPLVPVKILINLLKIFPDATLTMVGPDQGLLDEVIEYSVISGVRSKIEITGKVENSELYRYYQSHSVYINTTSYESFGVSLVEAASCGIPIVSNNVGEISIIWKDGRNILLVEDNDIQSYVLHISELFTNGEFYKAISNTARENIRKFDWELVKMKWIEILKS